jgi:hypothetical protein
VGSQPGNQMRALDNNELGVGALDGRHDLTGGVEVLGIVRLEISKLNEVYPGCGSLASGLNYTTGATGSGINN